MYYRLPFAPKKELRSEKNMLVALATLLSANLLFAQPAPVERSVIDNFKMIIQGNAADTAKVHAYYWLSRAMTLGNTTESVEWGNKGLDLAKKIKFYIGELECLE